MKDASVIANKDKTKITKWKKGSTSGEDEWMADPDWIEPI